MDFDLPDAKRVRRSDLYTSRSPSSSPDPVADPILESALHSRLAALYGPISLSLSSTNLDPGPSNPTSTPKAAASEAAHPHLKPEEQEPQQEAQEFEFRLFSAPDNNQDIQAQKIILADSSSELGEGGFVIRERARRFYIAEPATGEQKERFAFAALSGEEVLNLSRGRAWGLEVPWRVKSIRVLSTSKAKLKSDLALKSGHSLQNGEVLIEVRPSEGRKTPGKKRRIILREKQRKIAEREEAKRKERESKEEAEREKRTRRNREKKVKRKMKEKALIAGGPAGGGSGSGSDRFTLSRESQITFLARDGVV